VWSYIGRRVLIALPTLLLLVVGSFFLMRMAPGGPFTGERALPPQVLANIEARYGLDRPPLEQLAGYVHGVFTRFDFGPSFRYKDRTVNDIIAQGFPVTLTYGLLSFFLAVGVGGGIGIVAAVRRGSVVDRAAVGLSIVAQALPNFVMAPLLVLVFTLWLGWLPGGGWNGGEWPYLVMPVIALATSYLASIARLTRGAMLEVLGADFIRTARAKGMPAGTVILRHALRPALLPLVSYLGPTFVFMITGSVLIDLYFSTGGLGQYYVNSALNRDYAVMMGITILMGGLAILFNLLVDVLYALIDPRIRY
jgi:oligopeptide transport system permease protein